MRILIVTAGSRGDVAPFTGLGQRLQEAGHQVALAAHGRFADLVRECGLEYRALPGDPVQLVRARTAAPSRRPRDRSSPRSSTSWPRV
jgi:sterol 3beta-glucosyltransferase